MRLKPLLNIAISLVWLVNGLYCKVLNFVPRHQLIVAQILGPSHAGMLTILIGMSEILMAIWIVSRIQPKRCAITQAIIIAAMNITEYILAPDLLLFGRGNALVAALLIITILANEFAYQPIKSSKH